MPTYLQKRRRRWYAIMEIPAALRPAFAGKVRFVQSLETESVTDARQKVHGVVADWVAALERARRGASAGGDAARHWRALRAAKTEEQRSEVLERVQDAADAIGYLHAEMGRPPSSAPEAQQFFAEATGSRVPTVEHVDEWLSRSGSTPKTKDMHRAAVERFAIKFPMLRDVTRPEVRGWVAALMNDDKLTPKTVQRILSGLRGYWRHLQGEGVVPEADEPFAKLEVARQARNKAPVERRRPFEPSDLAKLIQGAVDRGDDQLADLIRLAMWTGCRIEELCALKATDVAGDRLTVREAKTAAGVRVVPIHAELAPTMARLTRDSPDGYVLSGLTFNKYGDRSNAIGKRFGHLRTALGFGPALVFHSIRKCFVTILENAGVSENLAADLAGHEKPRITYGLYSGGATLEVKAAALAKLSYPANG